MEDLLKKPFDLKRTEFWFATVLYVFAIFFLVSRSISPERFPPSNMWDFNEHHVLYSYYSNYFIPTAIRYTVLYGSFLLLTMYVVPAFMRKERLFLNIAITVALFVVIALIFSVTDTWLRAWLISRHPDLEHFYNAIFKENFIYAFWLMMMFAFYSVIKYAASYILLNSNKIPSRHQSTSRECAVALVVWMIIMLMLMGSNAPSEVIGCWGVIALYSIAFYWFSITELIPAIGQRPKRLKAYMLKALGLVLLSSVAILAITLSAGALQVFDDDFGFPLTLFNAAFQVLIVAPFAWVVYNRRLSVNAELYQLKTALGRSTADLQFLQSQINPHFLFNSLNTLYGTALQEKSERTANGIQKLGDMMRFMIHENHQESILLAREVEYLRNYIELQELRTQSTPTIRVETSIEDILDNKKIAPMLLIPFVENAFKHGISLSEPSWIKISLLTNEKELYFDVYNSIHPRTSEDPEKDHSGIGLENVKQRLALLYPKRHKLIIRETAKEFFIHLTVEF
ncbi:MAG: histidine kinase [Sphingobacteriaceae bacterium]|jgi:hypothetical protein|nr:histidine kinase [Sphingobacteriaceae bacterium]